MLSIRRAAVGALLAAMATAALAANAQAGVIVWRSTLSSAIKEAGDDGSAPHIIGHGSAPYISPDATHLAYGNAQNQLTVVSLATPSDPVHVLSGTWGGFANWSPDGRLIGAQIGRALVVIPVDTAKKVTLAHADHGWLSFAPASGVVAVDGYNDATRKPDLPLQLFPVGGGTPTRLQRRATGATGIVWSARNVIAFAVSSSHGPVFTEAITPGAKATVAARSAYDTYPDGWSADGSRLLIEEDRPNGTRMGYVTAGTHKIHLLPGKFTYVESISRDGRRALVTGHDAKGRYVAVVSLVDGSRVLTLRNAVDPSWTS